MVNVIRNLRARAAQGLTMMKLAQRGVGKPGTAPTGDQGERVLIGPANSAGQGYQWARSFERAKPDVRATSMQLIADDAFKFPVDLPAHAGYAAFSRSWQRAQFEALTQYRAVLIESNRGVAGRLYNSAAGQAQALTARGVQVGLIFHGSDIRDPDRHLAVEPDSYFASSPEFAETMRGVTRRSQELIAATGAPVFVSTVDLLSDVPHATWLPTVVDPPLWAGGQIPLSHGGVPQVVHVPSKSFIKGTELIEESMRELHELGLIRYQSVSGVPHSEMPELYRSADIVLDQFRGGPYGVAACEAMAAGRIVVSHVPHRDRVAELTGEELPIIEASAAALRETILRIIAEPAEALERAAAGPGFVTRIHNGDKSGRVLAVWVDGVEGGAR
ncbi:hypothetical protein [Salinibacterium sp. SWN167]|nr:hypothetical protein [Salinibacterium sp. SWN167]